MYHLLAEYDYKFSIMVPPMERLLSSNGFNTNLFYKILALAPVSARVYINYRCT